MGYSSLELALKNMRKEVLFAIVIGFSLGLLMTFGVWTANKAMNQTQTKKEVPQEQTIVPSPSQQNQLTLSITSPEDNTVSEEENISISGSTKAGAVVVVIYPEGEKILEANDNGQFSTSISLSSGSNDIEVSAYDKEGNKDTKTLSVVYSTAEF